MKNESKKRQTRKVGVAGGFINQMMGNNCSEPIVGEGATILHYSDREAYEVIEVSQDGMSCTIRKMDCTFVGSGYGDERYTYKSNPDGHTLNLEWNKRRKCWGSVSHSVQIIKSLMNRLWKEYDYKWKDHLPNGIKIEDITTSNEWGDIECKLVDGVTKRYKNFSKVSIIFGVMEQYRDPHF